MNNMNQNNGMQKRMLIMTLVVFVFFIAYEFLVLKPQQEAKAALVKQEQVQKQNAAPDVNASTQMVSTDVNGNPIDMSKSLDALSAKAIASSQIVSVIKTAKNINHPPIFPYFSSSAFFRSSCCCFSTTFFSSSSFSSC